MKTTPVPIVDVVLAVAAVAAVSLTGLTYFQRGSPGAPSTAEDQIPAMERSLVGRRLAPPEFVGANRAAPEGWAPANVVFVFSSTCPACEANAERWLDLAQSLAGQVSLIAVGNEPRVAMDAWLDRHGLPSPTLVLPQAPVPWGLTAVPTTLVVDGQGVVAAAAIGIMEAPKVELIREVLDSLLHHNPR